jgi:predicted nucleic acid-binding protein
MDGCILDASVTLSCLLGENSPYALRVLEEYLENQKIVFVPPLWHLEIRNILFLKEKRGFITSEYVDTALTFFDTYNISTDHGTTNGMSLSAINKLVRMYGLTTYDASYIELALRLNLPIATLDVQMIEVARELGCFLE